VQFTHILCYIFYLTYIIADILLILKPFNDVKYIKKHILNSYSKQTLTSEFVEISNKLIDIHKRAIELIIKNTFYLCIGLQIPQNHSAKRKTETWNKLNMTQVA